MNAKQQRFVDEYLVDKNATQAAIRVGYSAKTARQIGQQNLSKLHIAEAIAQGLDKQRAKSLKAAEKNSITEEHWVAGNAEMAFSNIMDFVDLRNGRLYLKDFPAQKARVIKKIISKADGEFTIEMHSKTSPMEMLGKHFGWVTEKLDIPPITINNQIQRTTVQQIFADPKFQAAALALAEGITGS